MNTVELAAAMEYDFEPVVHCEMQLDLLDHSIGGKVNVWCKVDTGMNRLGFDPDDAPEVLARLRRSAGANEIRLMTHLANADELGGSVPQINWSGFGQLPVASTATSASAIRRHPWDGRPSSEHGLNSDFTGDNWIRPGIALFGVSPFSDKSGPEIGLKPVMQFEARLIAIKSLKAGDRVGYKGAYRSEDDTTMGIISAGYGDGYSRHFRSGTPVLINGRRVPVIGNVSMDMIAVDLGDQPDDRVGDIATLWGDGLPVEEVAPWANAIPYELVCGVMNREDSESSNKKATKQRGQ